MGVLRSDLKAPSPVAAAAMERLAAIISKRGSQQIGTEAARGDEPSGGDEGGGTSRAWPRGVHACDVRRPQGVVNSNASPDMVVVARRGVHEFIGLIDERGVAEAAMGNSTEGADGSGSDVGDHAGCDRTDDLGMGVRAPRGTGSNAGAIARTHARDGAPAMQRHWSPPLTFMAWLAWRALTLSVGGGNNVDDRESEVNSRQASQCQDSQYQAGLVQTASMPAVAWVGRRVWPSVQLLHRCRGLLEASLLIDCDAAEASERTSREGSGAALSTGVRSRRRRTPGPMTGSASDMRAWAAEQALRCGGCVLVVADGSGLSRVMTQRLLLAAEAGSCSCLLARPPGDMANLSAATTRWLVRRAADICSTSHPSLDLDASNGTRDGASRDAKAASGEVWSTGWTARLWRSKGAAISQAERERAWLLRMVHRVDDFTRFNDIQRQARRRAHDVDAAPFAASGFDLVPVLVDRPAAKTLAAPGRQRRVAG